MHRFICIFITIFFVSSCSFKTDLNVNTLFSPKLVFQNMKIERIHDLKKDTYFDVQYFESYPTEKIWVGKNLYFIQYTLDSNSNLLEASIKGRVGSAFINEENKEFFFGDSVFFQIVKDNLTIHAPALFLDNNKNILKGPVKLPVTVKKGYDLTLSGTGFLANTLSKDFIFDHIDGEIINNNMESEK